jgi:hypothetical protein
MRSAGKLSHQQANPRLVPLLLWNRTQANGRPGNTFFPINYGSKPKVKDRFFVQMVRKITNNYGSSGHYHLIITYCLLFLAHVHLKKILHKTFYLRPKA